VVAVWNVGSVMVWIGRRSGPPPLDAAAQWVADNTSAVDRVAIPAMVAHEVPPSESAVRRILESYAGNHESARSRFSNLLSRAKGKGAGSEEIPDFVVDALFGEDEAQDVWCYRTMLFAAEHGGTPTSARDVWYYSGEAPDKPDQIAARAARELFLSGGVDYYVSVKPDAEVEAGGFTPAARFGATCVYARKAP
jgi:hypothetical protein